VAQFSILAAQINLVMPGLGITAKEVKALHEKEVSDLKSMGLGHVEAVGATRWIAAQQGSVSISSITAFIEGEVQSLRAVGVVAVPQAMDPALEPFVSPTGRAIVSTISPVGAVAGGVMWSKAALIAIGPWLWWIILKAVRPTMQMTMSKWNALPPRARNAIIAAGMVLPLVGDDLIGIADDSPDPSGGDIPWMGDGGIFNGGSPMMNGRRGPGGGGGWSEPYPGGVFNLSPEGTPVEDREYVPIMHSRSGRWWASQTKDNYPFSWRMGKHPKRVSISSRGAGSMKEMRFAAKAIKRQLKSELKMFKQWFPEMMPKRREPRRLNISEKGSGSVIVN